MWDAIVLFVFLLLEVLSVEHISIFVSYNLTLSDYFLRLSENAFSALFIYGKIYQTLIFIIYPADTNIIFQL